MRTSQLVLSTAVAAASLASASPAGAAPALDPGTFGSARKGSLLVSSSVLVSRKNVEMMGGWTNDRVICTATRRLTVRILIDRVRGGKTDRVRRSKTARVQNCAEGGPNFGFVIRASDVGMACPDGTWRPGRYDFVTTTRHHSSGLRAIATLFFRIAERC
jgi:hypothetical protein